jgi:hypothetical protein
LNGVVLRFRLPGIATATLTAAPVTITAAARTITATGSATAAARTITTTISSTATAVSTATPKTTAAATTTTKALLARTSFVDFQSAALQRLAIQVRDCIASLFIARHFHEGKTTGLASFSILNNCDGRDRSVSCESLPDIIFGCPKGQIPNIDVHTKILFPHFRGNQNFHSRRLKVNPSGIRFIGAGLYIWRYPTAGWPNKHLKQTFERTPNPIDFDQPPVVPFSPQWSQSVS